MAKQWKATNNPNIWDSGDRRQGGAGLRGWGYNKGKTGLENDTGQENSKLNGNKISETIMSGTEKNH